MSANIPRKFEHIIEQLILEGRGMELLAHVARHTIPPSIDEFGRALPIHLNTHIQLWSGIYGMREKRPHYESITTAASTNENVMGLMRIIQGYIAIHREDLNVYAVELVNGLVNPQSYTHVEELFTVWDTIFLEAELDSDRSWRSNIKREEE